MAPSALTVLASQLLTHQTCPLPSIHRSNLTVPDLMCSRLLDQGPSVALPMVSDSYCLLLQDSRMSCEMMLGLGVYGLSCLGTTLLIPSTSSENITQLSVAQTRKQELHVHCSMFIHWLTQLTLPFTLASRSVAYFYM